MRLALLVAISASGGKAGLAAGLGFLALATAIGQGRAGQTGSL
jgi:hypothetical protein